MWNGTAEILKAMPAATKTRPKMTPRPTLALQRRRDAGNETVPVKP